MKKLCNYCVFIQDEEIVICMNPDCANNDQEKVEKFLDEKATPDAVFKMATESMRNLGEALKKLPK